MHLPAFFSVTFGWTRVFRTQQFVSVAVSACALTAGTFVSNLQTASTAQPTTPSSVIVATHDIDSAEHELPLPSESTTTTIATTTATSTAPTTTRAPSSTTTRPVTTTSRTAGTSSTQTTKPNQSVRPTATTEGSFAQAPGASLRSGATCAAQVVKMRERRPVNAKANNTMPNAKPRVAGNLGSNRSADALLARVDGRYTGTTDEILQWAACKWGVDVEVVRAQAFIESTWRQSATAGVTDDQSKCPPGMTAPCPRAFGILQVRSDYHPNTYPYTVQSTAYAADYAMGLWRACYEGVSYLGAKTRGDQWGCIAWFYSGGWGDDPGKAYANNVQVAMREKPWLHW